MPREPKVQRTPEDLQQRSSGPHRYERILLPEEVDVRGLSHRSTRFRLGQTPERIGWMLIAVRWPSIRVLRSQQLPSTTTARRGREPTSSVLLHTAPGRST
jgi:hypothetical protein